jgi:3-oxoadipate enol-lactonase
MSERIQVRSGDAELSVQVDGREGRPWLVLSNSLGADLTMWEPQMEALLPLRRVVRYDTRGHGRSSAPAGPYSFDQLVGDVVDILDHLAVAKADVMGLSLGGMTALGLALDHPGRVDRVICCDARAEYPAAALASWDERLRAVRSGGVSSLADETLVRWFTEPTRNERPEMIARMREMIVSTSDEGYCGCVAALKSLDYLRRLPSLRHETLYVVGAEDGGAPVDAMRAMAEATPRGKLTIIPAAAHISNMERPAEFNEAVCGFLGSTASA